MIEVYALIMSRVFQGGGQAQLEVCDLLRLVTSRFLLAGLSVYNLGIPLFSPACDCRRHHNFAGVERVF